MQSDEVTGLILQIVKCLAFMHSKGIIHRDLKPENLLISRDMRLKLCDFGFTRSLPQANEELTDYVATRWYRSPELLVGEPYSKPLDMWSLGCIMF
jgi:cyclin-dependent kinase-like